MYDIPELEKKWRKYKRKKIQKPIIIATTLVVLGVGASIIASTYLNKTDEKPVANNSKVVSKQTTSTIAQDTHEKAIVITRVNRNGEPVINSKPVTNPEKEDELSAKSIDISKAEIVKPNVPDDEIRVIGFDNKEKNKIKKKYEDVLIPSKSKQDIEFREKILEIEERFKSYQDPKDSLTLAKMYYKKGNYKKAESWAVSTNNIDGDIEESWLIFAKSRAKQGFRKDAIKVLQSYYDETNSAKAKDLLVKIRFGKSF